MAPVSSGYFRLTGLPKKRKKNSVFADFPRVVTCLSGRVQAAVSENLRPLELDVNSDASVDALGPVLKASSFGCSLLRLLVGQLGGGVWDFSNFRHKGRRGLRFSDSWGLPCFLWLDSLLIWSSRMVSPSLDCLRRHKSKQESDEMLFELWSLSMPRLVEGYNNLAPQIPGTAGGGISTHVSQVPKSGDVFQLSLRGR